MEEKLRLELVRLGDRSARLREAEQTIARLRQENAQLQAEMQQAAAAMMQVLREAGERIPEQGEWKAIGIARMNLKVWATAIHEYARAHGQAMPASLDEAVAFFPEHERHVLGFFDPDQFERSRTRRRIIADPTRSPTRTLGDQEFAESRLRGVGVGANGRVLSAR